MIRLTTHDGRTEWVATENIARITEASTSSQWHGVRAIVRTFDGGVLEVNETAERVAELVKQAATPPQEPPK